MPVPKLEEFKAPWEMKDGKDVPADEQVVDKDALKKYLHGLLSDKEKAQIERDAAKQERDTFKNEIESKKREGESEEARLKRELEEANSKLAKAGETSLETMRLRAALKAGLGEEHVDRIIGTTQEELDSDAETLKKSFGGNGKQADDTDPRGRPKPVRTPGDPDPDEGDVLDVDKALTLIPRTNDF